MAPNAGCLNAAARNPAPDLGNRAGGLSGMALLAPARVHRPGNYGSSPAKSDPRCKKRSRRRRGAQSSVLSLVELEAGDITGHRRQCSDGNREIVGRNGNPYRTLGMRADLAGGGGTAAWFRGRLRGLLSGFPAVSCSMIHHSSRHGVVHSGAGGALPGVAAPQAESFAPCLGNRSADHKQRRDQGNRRFHVSGNLAWPLWNVKRTHSATYSTPFSCHVVAGRRP